jgi:hypothetical protein
VNGERQNEEVRRKKIKQSLFSLFTASVLRKISFFFKIRQIFSNGGTMEHTYVELKKKTVAEMREIAKDIEHEAVKGYSQMNKEHLLVALCKALNIDTHIHHEVKGVNKAAIKLRIKTMKDKLDAAIAAGDRKQIKFLHRQIHRQKRQIHKAMV